jgi:hypothetical protein
LIPFPVSIGHCDFLFLVKFRHVLWKNLGRCASVSFDAMTSLS